MYWMNRWFSTAVLSLNLREKFSREIRDIVEKIHFNLSGGKEKLSLSYEKDCTKEEFRDKIKRNREKDIKTRITNEGPSQR